MRVAIVHDDLVQWGGAERMLEGICQVFPQAPIFTSVFDKSNKTLMQKFGSKKILTSFLQKIPMWKRLYKLMFPLYPLAFEQFTFDEFDLVISQTTRYAHTIITKPKTKHISYCHTPPRFLWNFSQETPPSLTQFLLSYQRIFDQIASQRVDYFLAGSKNAKKRIKKVYKRESDVLYPFIDLTRFRNIKPFDGGYLVTIGRLNKYKRVDLVVKAAMAYKFPLKVIGSGPELQYLKKLSAGYPLIEFWDQLNDMMVLRMLSGAKVLVVAGIEDFGLTPLEAQALGKPVIAFKKGGALETVIDGKTGVFFENQNVESLIKAIQKLDQIKINPLDCSANALKFNKENFTRQLKQIVAEVM